MLKTGRRTRRAIVGSLAMLGAATAQAHSGNDDDRKVTIYNNMPVITDWVFQAPPNENGNGLRRFSCLQPGHKFTLDTPITDPESGSASFALWGTVSPNHGAKNVETWLNLFHAADIPAEHRTDPNWTSQLRWYHEAEEGQAELALALHPNARDLIGGDSGDIYLKRYNNPHEDGQIEILHPLCRWVNDGKTVQERAERAQVFARAMDETARGVKITQNGGNMAGQPGQSISPFLLGLELKRENPDWLGLEIVRVREPQSIWGDQLPWRAGDIILEFNGSPVFNSAQLAFLLTKHVMDKGIEAPCTAVVKKPDGRLQQYEVSYRYNEEVWTKVVSAAQARRFIIAEDSLWGPALRLFINQKHYTGRPMTQEEKSRMAKESRMLVYQLYPNEVKQGQLLSWLVPSPLRVVAVGGRLAKGARAVQQASRTRNLVRNLSITGVEVFIATHQEPLPKGSEGVREEAAARGVAQSLVFDKTLELLTRRR